MPESKQTINIPSRDPESTALLRSLSSPTVLFVIFWFLYMQQLSAEMEALSIPICWRTLSKKAANQSNLNNNKKNLPVSLLTFLFSEFFFSALLNLCVTVPNKIKLYCKKIQKPSSSFHIQVRTYLKVKTFTSFLPSHKYHKKVF